jgi:hypothetical protein
MVLALVLGITPAFAAIGISVDGVNAGKYEEINFATGTTVTQTGTRADVTLTSTGTTSIINAGTINTATIGQTTPAAGKFTTLQNTGAFLGSTENVATSAANPGVGVGSVATLTTCVTTDETGASADVLTLADGTNGQIKIVNLKSNAETAGLKVTPTNILGATTDVLLSATGDSVVFVFNGAAWDVVTTTGTKQ